MRVVALRALEAALGEPRPGELKLLRVVEHLARLLDWLARCYNEITTAQRVARVSVTCVPAAAGELRDDRTKKGAPPTDRTISRCSSTVAQSSQRTLRQASPTSSAGCQALRLVSRLLSGRQGTSTMVCSDDAGRTAAWVAGRCGRSLPPSAAPFTPRRHRPHLVRPSAAVCVSTTRRPQPHHQPPPARRRRRHLQ